jgi:hypothetical protein
LIFRRADAAPQGHAKGKQIDNEEMILRVSAHKVNEILPGHEPGGYHYV